MTGSKKRGFPTGKEEQSTGQLLLLGFKLPLLLVGKGAFQQLG